MQLWPIFIEVFMRCNKHLKSNCEICFPRKTESTDDGFALGIVTGIAISEMGMVGAAIHNSMTDNSSNCDSSNSTSSHSGSCGGDF